MNLSYSTTFPPKLNPVLASQPTNFVPKILKSIQQYNVVSEDILQKHLMDYVFLQRKLNKPYKTDVEHPKLHTIRHDANNRWKTGNLIHFYIYSRKPHQLLFAPILLCTSTQKIDVVWHDADGFKLAVPNVYVNNRWIVGSELKQLALNDGFSSVETFFMYFHTDFSGKIIHWTNLKY